MRSLSVARQKSTYMMPAVSSSTDTKEGESPSFVVHHIRSISPSSVQDWLRCKLLFKFRYVLKIPTPNSVEMLRGSIIHLALSELYECDKRLRTPEKLEKLFRLEWAKLRTDPEIAALFPTRQDEREWGLKALELLRNYFLLEEPSKNEPYMREKRFTWQAEARRGSKEEPMFVTGILDRLDKNRDGKLRVLDYKTGKAPNLKYNEATNKKILDEKFVQLKIYALLTGKELDVPRRLELLFLDGPSRLTLDVEPQFITDTDKLLRKVWQEVKFAEAVNDFPATKNHLCEWCAYRDICPAMNLQKEDG